MKRLIFSSFFALYFFSSVASNIATEEKVFYEFVYGRDDDGIVNSWFKRGGNLTSLFVIFSEYTGAETGFGLYAPRVSSQVVIYFSIKDESGQIVKTLQPNYTSKEVLLRFYTVYGDALNKLKGQAGQETDESKLFDVVLKSLAFKILLENPPQKNIDADVYVYDLPTLRAYPNNPQITYTHLLHYEYSLPKDD
jgi:hypothetical protein